MRASRWCFFLLAGLAAPLAHATACPDTKTLDAIASMGSVFIGEMHGTNETPAFVQCVVEHDIAKGMHPIVALEQLSPSRDLHWPGWSAADGRHSKAMARLVAWLDQQEKAGRLSIHWMEDSWMATNPTTMDSRDQYMGEGLVPLVSKGLVIAYAGNAHAQKTQHMGADVKPSGAYVADTMVHIDVTQKDAGMVWACIGTCGVHQLPGSKKVTEVGKLLPAGSLGFDNLLGFDYVYAVPSFTASPPQLDATRTPATAHVTPHP